MDTTAIQNIYPLQFQWETPNPFLFCVHHADDYPKGNKEMGPIEPLTGRTIGQDFRLKDGWRMYHGERVPGFPMHPHRGFETVTVVRRGFVDHSDSHGAAGRYGNGDVQWMTAGSGLQHAEMFPLLRQDERNPLELFQIWLNLPAKRKFADPHFKMLWAEDIPVVTVKDDSEAATRVTLIAGELEGRNAPAPAPDSWAADAENGVAIWIIEMESGARWTLPTAQPDLKRTLFFYDGDALRVSGSDIASYHGVELAADQPVELEAGNDGPVSLLMLQGHPIQETVVQYGPFVMNTKEEIHAAFADYQRTQFGGWPYDRPDPVNPLDRGRFARYADGREETPIRTPRT